MDYNSLINNDFQNRRQPKRHPGLRWLTLMVGCAVISAVLASTSSDEEDDTLPEVEHHLQALNNDLSTSQSKKIIPLPLPNVVNKAPVREEIQDDINRAHQWKTLTVKSGNTLSGLFDKAGIQANQLHQLMQLGKETRPLRRIHPGDKIQVEANADGQLLALHYDIDSFKYLRVTRQDDQLIAKTLQHAIETRQAHASGVIESSLFAAAYDAGLSQNLTMELANIFGWDIDFALDIRQGDRFTVLYEEIYKDGEKLRDGNIVAAEFVNQNRLYRALRYTNPTTGAVGYYSENGHSLRKAFLRSPVNFSRISSRFTRKRFHPILNKIRSHKGVDYAARTGTPVRSSGDGKVIFRGRKGGYGNVVIVKHGSRYSTLYAHLSKFNRKARNGSKVKQGQIIGYVGSSGLASGPHLHYEFRVNGVHRNPLTVKFPSTQPIPKRHRDNFELTTAGYIAQLDVLSRIRLALNQN